MTSHGLLVEERPVTSLLLSRRAQAFNMRIQNVTPVLSPSASEWPPDCLGYKCRTLRSLYETWEKLQAPQLNLLQLKISPKHPASTSAQDWISPQPSYCASSPIISIPGNEMLCISWKLTPWITSLHMDGKAYVYVSVVEEGFVLLLGSFQSLYVSFEFQ